MLTIVDMPGTEAWALSDRDAERIVHLVGDNSIRLEYWPRRMADVAWSRHRDMHPSSAKGYWYPDGMAFQLRGYSLVSATDGAVAVVFVDEREDYESTTFVALHELAHLLVIDADDDETHADLIASAMMAELGYSEGVREALTSRPFRSSSAGPRPPRFD